MSPGLVQCDPLLHYRVLSQVCFRYERRLNLARESPMKVTSSSGEDWTKETFVYPCV